MFTNTPSDRVQLVGLGELLSPACCMICRSGNCDEGYARLGVWYDYEGEQYLCRTCVIQVAELFSCLTPEEAQHVKDAATEYAALNNDLFQENEVLRERLRVFNDALAGINPDLPRILSGSAASTADEVEAGSNEVDAGITETPNGDESEPAESITESRPANLSESTGIDITESGPNL